jgi:hypothetical protein
MKSYLKGMAAIIHYVELSINEFEQLYEFVFDSLLSYKLIDTFPNPFLEPSSNKQ